MVLSTNHASHDEMITPSAKGKSIPARGWMICINQVSACQFAKFTTKMGNKELVLNGTDKMTSATGLNQKSCMFHEILNLATEVVKIGLLSGAVVLRIGEPRCPKGGRTV